MVHVCHCLIGMLCDFNEQVVLHYRSWCTDRVIPQARKYIANSMGARYADPVILDLEKTWEEGDIRTPLICFLSMGSDPTNQIEGLAKKLKVGKYFN